MGERADQPEAGGGDEPPTPVPQEDDREGGQAQNVDEQNAVLGRTNRWLSPYVGAGVNAMLFYGGEDQNGFKVDIDNGFGGALQAGVDIALQGPWSLNLDAKKVFFDTEASINGGALKSDVTLDPWVISVGVARRF